MNLKLTDFFLVTLVMHQASVLGSHELLVVTPHLAAGGSITEARKLSMVYTGNLGVKSNSGFFDVNEACSNHLFFWFFPAEENWETSPVVVWLSGGPEMSSVSGVFDEIGPFRIEAGEVVKRSDSLTAKYNILFLEQQVGMGFSFSGNECYPRNVQDVVTDTYSAMVQFFKMFHELQQNKVLIIGALFVAHLGPALAEVVEKNNEKTQDAMRINIHAILTINARTSIECHDISNFLYILGLVEDKGRKKYKDLHLQVRKKAKSKMFLEAATLERSMLTELIEETSLPSYHNYAADADPISDLEEFFSGKIMRSRLHVGDVKFHETNEEAFKSLYAEYFSSPKKRIENLLKNGKVIVGFYSGQLEIARSSSSTECLLKSLQWPGKDDYKKEVRDKWYVNDDLLGWIKSYGNLFHVWGRKAGQYPAFATGRTALTLVEGIFDSTPDHVLLRVERYTVNEED